MSHFLIPYSQSCRDAAKVSGGFLSGVVCCSEKPAPQHRISVLIVGREVSNIHKYDVVFII